MDRISATNTKAIEIQLVPLAFLMAPKYEGLETPLVTRDVASIYDFT